MNDVLRRSTKWRASHENALDSCDVSRAKMKQMMAIMEDDHLIVCMISSGNVRA